MPMEYIGRHVILAVAQEPFDISGDSGVVNSFATLVPLLTSDGEALSDEAFQRRGLVFWLIRQHALGFADPGRLISGRLERAIHPEKGHEYQLTPDSAKIVEPSDLIEVLTVSDVRVTSPRDLVNIRNVLQLDHPPTPLALVRVGNEVFGPLRSEAIKSRPDLWNVSFHAQRADRTVFRFPAEHLDDQAKFGAYCVRDIVASIAYDSQDPSRLASGTHFCHYSVLLGDGFKHLPAMGYPQVSVETDQELLLRYTRKFAGRKEVQRLRELLSELSDVIEESDDVSTEAERAVFEALKRRTEQMGDELVSLARSLVTSGLIDQQIDQALKIRTDEYVSQQVASLSAEIAERVASIKAELDGLEHRKESLEEELAQKRLTLEHDVERVHSELEALRNSEYAKIDEAKRDLDQQRDTLSTHLESIIAKYSVAKDEVITQFALLSPFFERAGINMGSRQELSKSESHQKKEPVIDFPAFVTGAPESSEPIMELSFFERFERHVKDSGYNYRRMDLASFHLSTKCCDLTILGGISGTGKSSLPRLYAEALAGSSVEGTARFLQVGVSPGWLDMRDLLGHVNSLDRRFEPSESGLYRQLVNAQQEFRGKEHETGIYFCVLDEMNLSHVEYYFSGFLQALEQIRSVPCFDASNVDPSTTFAQFATLMVPRSVRFIGTVNFDETTKQLSYRVLDRANLLRIRPTELTTSLPPSITDRRPVVKGPAVKFRDYREWRKTGPLEKEIAAIWDRIQGNFLKLGAPITSRRRLAIQDFIASSPKDMLSPIQAFDLQIAQRLLPQVRGLFRPLAQESLDDLERVLSQYEYGFPESIATITDIRENEQIGVHTAEALLG